MVIKSAAATNAGKIRENNEDNFYICGKYKESAEMADYECSCDEKRGAYLYSVCDGMGGAQFGELAALLAVKTLAKYENNFDVVYSKYVDEANALICDEINAHDGKRIGTTFTALSICGDIARAYNIGDSRIYMLRNGELSQLSVDHTQAQMLVRQGIITAEQAKTHKHRNVLTQHFGIFPEEMVIEPSVAEPIEIMVGDIFLLCSDGLTDMVSEEAICSTLLYGDKLKEIADKLIGQAIENGGHDNVTVLVVKVFSEAKKQNSYDTIERLLRSVQSSPDMDYLVEELMDRIKNKVL